MIEHWLIVGSGPGAERAKDIDSDVVITANGGLATVPDADFYWISDPVAIEVFRPLWEPYTGIIVCNEDIGRETLKFPYLHLGPERHGRTSGTLCALVALSFGAKKLTFVGHCGYEYGVARRRMDGSYADPLDERAVCRLNTAMSNALYNMAISFPFVDVTVHQPGKLRTPPGWKVVG